ncbi:FtsW/RodA/SpoVE family cell cycle protein, partial [Effusibacillus lacus]
MFLAQVFENVGMTMSMMPITGITLPLMSYGGSSIVTSMLGVGLVLNVGYRRKKIKF